MSDVRYNFRIGSKTESKMASIDYSIKDLQKVVKFDGKVKNIEVSRLTAPGENYLSLVLRVDFEVETNGHSKTISSVAKCLPPKTKKEAFYFQGTAMKNEIRWYSEIIPMLKGYAKENGLEATFFPELYGSRYSLNSSQEEPDSDSVLLLENLIPQGYQNDDRYIGCDLSTSKAILKNLALFHALPIGMKVTQPERFQIIKDNLDEARPKIPDGPDGKKRPFALPPGAEQPKEIFIEKLSEIPNFTPYFGKIKTLLEKQPKGPTINFKLTKEPWNTVTHNDFWVNNFMVNRSSGKEPVVKIVDFQMCLYGSYAKDLVFFLLTNVRNDVIRESMDVLIRLYYDEFTSILRQTNANLELTYDEYLEELRSAAIESEFVHAILFSTIIFGEKDTGVDVAVEEIEPHKHLTSMIRKMSQNQKDKLVLITSEADKRDWIKSF